MSAVETVEGRSAPSGVMAAELAMSASVVADRYADVSMMGDLTLLDVQRSLEAVQSAVDSARLSLIGEIDARSLTQRTVGLSTKAWLGHEFLLAGPVIGSNVSVARKLRRILPLTEQALRDGVITYEHAALLCRLATSRIEHIVIDLEPQLIALAGDVRFERWATEVRALIDHADPDGGHSPGPEHNRLSMSDGLSGELHLEIDLHGADAASTKAILLAELERRYDAHRRLANANDEHITPGRAGLQAEAFVELIRRGLSAGAGTKAPVTDVTMVVQASDPVNGHTPGGVRLQDDTTRLLMCDAVIHAVIVNSLGVPIDMGRGARFFTPAQQRAIHARDGGCVMDGCDVPEAWTHIHHVEGFVADNGETNLMLGAPLCPAVPRPSRPGPSTRLEHGTRPVGRHPGVHHHHPVGEGNPITTPRPTPPGSQLTQGSIELEGRANQESTPPSDRTMDRSAGDAGYVCTRT